MTDFSMPPIGVWSIHLEMVPMARSREAVVELESLGYGAIWVADVAGRDPLVHLGQLLAATDRIIGATGIVSIWGRDAVTMAGGVKTLTEAFPERVLLGLGVSHANLVEGVRKQSYDKPLTKMRAYLDDMDAAPFQGFRPTTPVRRVLAALRPKMLRLAAERTDGAHPYFVPPEHTEGARQVLGAGPLLCVEQMVLLEPEPTKARDKARQAIANYLRQPNYQNNLRDLGYGDDDFAEGGSDRLVDAVVAWGDEQAVQDRVKAHLDAGADHVCIQALGVEGRDIPMAAWRTLAAPLLEVGRAH
jgi:probable F420-dependent oxidoreductase